MAIPFGFLFPPPLLLLSWTPTSDTKESNERHTKSHFMIRFPFPIFPLAKLLISLLLLDDLRRCHRRPQRESAIYGSVQHTNRQPTRVICLTKLQRFISPPDGPVSEWHPVCVLLLFSHHRHAESDTSKGIIRETIISPGIGSLLYRVWDSRPRTRSPRALALSL